MFPFNYVENAVSSLTELSFNGTILVMYSSNSRELPKLGKLSLDYTVLIYIRDGVFFILPAVMKFRVCVTFFLPKNFSVRLWWVVNVKFSFFKKIYSKTVYFVEMFFYKSYEMSEGFPEKSFLI